MNNVLLVSGTEKGRDTLIGFLKSDFGVIETNCLQSGSEARRLLAENDYDLVIINAPLTDEFGHDLSIYIAEECSSGVIIIVKSEMADDVAARVEDYGVLVLPKPFNRYSLFQSVKLANAARRRLLGLQSENIKLQNKIEEIRIVDRAKCVLIQYLNMTEPQAHRYIERQAMNLRTTRKQIALDLLKTYET